MLNSSYVMDGNRKSKEHDSVDITAETRELDLILRGFDSPGAQEGINSESENRGRKKKERGSEVKYRDSYRNQAETYIDKRGQELERLPKPRSSDDHVERRQLAPDAHIDDGGLSYDPLYYEYQGYDRIGSREVSIRRALAREDARIREGVKLEQLRRSLEEFPLSRKYSYTDRWSLQEELNKDRELERLRREVLEEKDKADREYEMRLMLEEESKNHVEIQRIRFEKEIILEKQKMHEMFKKEIEETLRLERQRSEDRMMFQNRRRKENALQEEKRVLEIQLQREIEDKDKEDEEAEMWERDVTEERDRLRREIKYRQAEEEKKLVANIKELKLQAEMADEKYEDERLMEERLEVLRNEKEELEEKLKVKKRSKATDNEKQKTNETAKDDKSFTKPKLPQFNGNQFEEWKLEVTSLIETKMYSEFVLVQVIRNSISGKAWKVLLTLKASASTKEILKKMEDIYGNIRSGDSIVYDFYSAKQQKDEKCTEWGIRLEMLFNQAVERGEIEESRKDAKLKERLWRGLQSENLKVATRSSYESTEEFDILRKKARREELELESESGKATEAISTDTACQTPSDKTSCQVIQNKNTTDAKIDLLLKKIGTLETSLEELRSKDRDIEFQGKTGGSYRGRYPSRYRGSWQYGRRRFQREDNSASRWRNRKNEGNKDQPTEEKEESKETSKSDKTDLNRKVSLLRGQQET